MRLSGNSPARSARRAKESSGRIPPEGRIVSFTKSKGSFQGIVELPSKERVFGKIICLSGKIKIGDCVRPVLRILSKGLPIEYGFSWECIE